jgi:hypothetical protein
MTLSFVPGGRCHTSPVSIRFYKYAMH